MSTTFYFAPATTDHPSESAGPMKLKNRFVGFVSGAAPMHPAPTDETPDIKSYRRALRAAEMEVWNQTGPSQARSDHRWTARNRKRLADDADKWLFIFLTLCAAIVLRSL